MAKNVIRLTESELKNLIKESVNTILSEMDNMNEGAGFDTLKILHNDIKNASDKQVNKGIKDLVKGYPEIVKGEPNEIRYNNLKFDRRNNLNRHPDASVDELMAQPGFAGKAKRAAVGAAVAGMAAGEKLKRRFKR